MRFENSNDVAPEIPANRWRRVALTAALTLGVLVAPGGAARADTADVDDVDRASGWLGTWATALVPASDFDTGRSLSGFQNESIRMILQTSIGGDRVRIRLSNAYGANDMVIGHATVGRRTAASAPDLEPRSVKELSFHGGKTVTIPAGGEVFSDPVALSVDALSQLAVTLYLPAATGPMTWHWIAMETSYVYAGDHAADPTGAGFTSTQNHFYLLGGIEVTRERRSDRAVAVLGDSVSDGFGTTVNANHRWPDQLARRLVTERPGQRISVVNVAIAGNAIAHDGDEIGLPEIGVSAFNRLDTDVFPLTGVRTVIVELGLNDIFQHDETSDVMIAGLHRIAGALHRHGLRVVMATMSPAAGDPSWTPAREAAREAVNAYIRCTHDADDVIDVAAALADPANPTQLDPAFDSGDHVHPSDAGAAALARAVPLSAL